MPAGATPPVPPLPASWNKEASSATFSRHSVASFPTCSIPSPGVSGCRTRWAAEVLALDMAGQRGAGLLLPLLLLSLDMLDFTLGKG